MILVYKMYFFHIKVWSFHIKYLQYYSYEILYVTRLYGWLDRFSSIWFLFLFSSSSKSALTFRKSLFAPLRIRRKGNGTEIEGDINPKKLFQTQIGCFASSTAHSGLAGNRSQPRQYRIDSTKPRIKLHE